MKKNQRYVSALLACLIAAGSLAGCGPTAQDGHSDTAGSAVSDLTAVDPQQANLPVDEEGNLSPFGKYPEPITVEIVQSINPTSTLPEGDSATDNYFTRYIKENMNIDIKVKWQASTADYAQKLNLAIASNDLPDLLTVGESDFRKMIKSDQLAEMTPYYETFASDIIKDNISKTDGKAIAAASHEGKMYGLPGVQVEADSYNVMWIRQDWLDKLGLDVPTDIASLEAVAKAFVDNKMGGENTVGILSPTINGRLYNDFLSSANNMNNLDGIFQAYQSWPGFWVEDEDGSVVYGSIMPETKEALSELNKMYESGILDQEIGVRQNADEAWKSGQAGILFSPWWMGYNLLDALANDPTMEWKAYATPLAEDGQWYPKLSAVTTSICVVHKGYEHPEAAILLNNFIRRDESKLTSETTLHLGYYPGRVVIAELEEINYTAEALYTKINGGTVPEFDPLNYKLLESDLASLETCLTAPYEDLGIENWDTQDPNFGRLYSVLMGFGDVVESEKKGITNKVYSAIYSQTETMEKKWANLKKKEDEVFLKIIIGEEPIDAFDTFVEEWKAEGGDEITAEVQAQVQG